MPNAEDKEMTTVEDAYFYWDGSIVKLLMLMNLQYHHQVKLKNLMLWPSRQNKKILR